MGRARRCTGATNHRWARTSPFTEPFHWVGGGLAPESPCKSNLFCSVHADRAAPHFAVPSAAAARNERRWEAGGWKVEGGHKHLGGPVIPPHISRPHRWGSCRSTATSGAVLYIWLPSQRPQFGRPRVAAVVAQNEMKGLSQRVEPRFGRKEQR